MEGYVIEDLINLDTHGNIKTIISNDSLKECIQLINSDNHLLLQQYIQSGRDINQDLPYNITLLHLAVMSGKIVMIKLLINSGANINALDYENETPLFWAVKWNKLSSVKTLLSFNPDINIESYPPGGSAYDMAIRKDYKEIIGLLETYK